MVDDNWKITSEGKYGYQNELIRRYMQAKPSYSSLTSEPLTVDEIDASPQRDRIWALVSLLIGDNT